MIKSGDLVFLNKRGLIDWETQNHTANLIKNRVYNVSRSQENFIMVDGVCIHPSHFTKIDGDSVQGVNIFKKDDIVIIDKNATFGDIEIEYNISRCPLDLIENIAYIVTSYHHDVRTFNDYSIDMSYVRAHNVGYNSYLIMHPNYFKKTNEVKKEECTSYYVKKPYVLKINF